MKRQHRFVTSVLAAAVTLLQACDVSEDIPAGSRSAPAAGAWQPLWGDVASAKLRPGSLIYQDPETGVPYCTAAFLFVDPLSQTYYMGTAAHCFDDADRGTWSGVGIRVTLDEFGEIGTVVFDSDIPQPADSTYTLSVADFILVQLDVGINLIANPRMFSFEGPTGIATCAQTSPGDLLGLDGQGLVATQTDTHGRQGVLSLCRDGSNYRGVFPSSGGDSGGPVLHLASGRAMGVHSGVGIEGHYGGQMGRIFYELDKAGFGSVALATIDGGYVLPEIRACTATGCD